MTNKGLLAILLFTLSGCGFFSNKVESLVTSDDNDNRPLVAAPKINKKDLHCPDTSKTQLLLEDEASLQYYQQLLSKMFEGKTYSFVQKAALLSLVEMNKRPDEISPSSRMQYFLRINGKSYYFDFRPKKADDFGQMPYLKSLDYLLKTFDKNKTLVQLAEALDQTLPQTMNISPDLEDFLNTNKSDIIKNEFLAETFLKGDEVLTKHESFKKISLRKFISSFYSQKLADDSMYDYSKNPLIDVEAPTGLKLKCNVDINKENPLKEEIFFATQKKSHYFAIKDGDNFFIAASSAIFPKPFKNFENTYFIKAHHNPIPLPLCQFKDAIQDMVLFSTKGRNSSQHLKHLISYDIQLADNYSSLEELLNFSRHLFLTNPDRILYESKRGRKSQLDFFLTMNFPIYHVESLGDIVGFAGLQSGKREEKSLIIDDRSQARLWCAP